MEALRQRSAAEWKKLFEDRYMRTEWPHGSGVWGKREWVHPHIRDENVVSMYEGGSNLFWPNAMAPSWVSTIYGSSCAATRTPDPSKIWA